MEPLVKETIIKDHSSNDWGGGGNLRAKANWGLGLGIVGAVAGVTALSRQGGVAGVLGGGAAPASSVTYNTGGGSCTPFAAYSKECDDILAVTKGYYELAIAGMSQAAQAREVDVAEKFGLFINNRNAIEALKDKTNAEFFSLYKYTRDKDDETNDRIAKVEVATAVNSAVRPYQDKLIQCEIDKAFTALKNYIDRKTCRMIEGVNTLPLTPEITGVLSQTCCNQQLLAALAGGGAAA